MKRTVLDFSLRTEAEGSLDDMGKLVEQALGCKLVRGNYHGMPVLKSMLLGMQVLLSEWRGLDGKETFQLHGLVDDPKFLEGSEPDLGVIGIDINQAIIDLLALRGAGDWHVPTRAEIEAEIEYGEEVRKDFLTTEDDSEDL
ncbi:MAG TPA: hypothetical protein VN937_05975 [Blastocatellia bacterium]|nr:hypothetical protein [Blastocatellia bacterium]